MIRLALAAGFVTALAPLPLAAGEVLVFAAASMKTALDDFAASWEVETGHEVTVSYAGSSQLAQQIIAGAPAGIFISAAVSWMDEVERSGLLVEGTRQDLLGNTLVLIAHGQGADAVEIAALPDLLGDERLAMALVESVPAGQYGKAALTTLGLWNTLAPSVAQSDNVRAALALVSTGEAPYGIVYSTDAAANDNVTIVASFPADSHPPIIYPAALLTEAAEEADRAFFEALGSAAASAAFERQGFSVLDRP